MMYQRIHRQSVGVFRRIVVAFCDADVRGCRRAAVGAAGALLGSSCLFLIIMAGQAWKFIHNFRAGTCANMSATANFTCTYVEFYEKLRTAIEVR